MIFRIVTLVALIWGVAGCAGARATVTAEHARYPISASHQVRDDAGNVHGRATLQTVGRLQASSTKFGLLYSLVTVPSSYDISDEVNSQVEAAGGEAVILLDVSVTGGCDVLNGFPVLNVLPIWPGCVPITVEGDIVKRRLAPPLAVPAASGASPASPAPNAAPAALPTGSLPPPAGLPAAP
jgi:hypothetical protein